MRLFTDFQPHFYRGGLGGLGGRWGSGLPYHDFMQNLIKKYPDFMQKPINTQPDFMQKGLTKA